MISATTHVREVMTEEVVSLDAADHLDLASDIMTLGRIRHMPVLSAGRLVGILSQRDLFRAAISSVLRFRAAAEREWLAGIRVGEVMTRNVATAWPEWSIRQAVDLMLEKKIGCLPVVADGRLVGLLSESDCLGLLAQMLARAEHNNGCPPP
jgi:CBS domain-containing protein